MNKLYLLLLLCCGFTTANAQNLPEKPHILISSDIGGTDPDDNQSMTHLFMYSNLFHIEGLVSSPSFGNGSKTEILRMIDVYEKDYPLLRSHRQELASPEYLRSICKQGRHGSAPLSGYDCPTEGSDWIVRCAKNHSDSPLWILVWGGLEDLAQALHDAPDISSHIRVYWIGGPNKKWCVNSYAYIASHFPHLWFIENNASYRGLISDSKNADEYNAGYYDKNIKGAGNLGADFIRYYKGVVKMGDTPSLLYMMNGNPNDPESDSWGGSFEKISHSPRIIFDRNTTVCDSVPVYSVLEFIVKGPKTNIPTDSACITLTVDKQEWKGFYIGKGRYMVRYCPKAPAKLDYTIRSDIKGFKLRQGTFVVYNKWPGNVSKSDFVLGKDWYSDKTDQTLFEKGWQGAKTISRWRNQVLDDWAGRWNWLKSPDMTVPTKH